MTSQTEAQYLAERREQVVALIRGVTAKEGVAPGQINVADAKRLKFALDNIPLTGMPDGRAVWDLRGTNVEDLAVFILTYGQRLSETLRENEALRTRVNALEAEKSAFRRFIGTEQ